MMTTMQNVFSPLRVLVTQISYSNGVSEGIVPAFPIICCWHCHWCHPSASPPSVLHFFF